MSQIPSGPVGETVSRHGAKVAGKIDLVIGFIKWMLTPITWIFGKSRGPQTKSAEVTLYSVHRSFYLMPMIVFGLLFALMHYIWPHTGTVFGWLYMAVIYLTFTAVLYDISFKKFVICFGVFMIIWLGSKYLEAFHHLPLLGNVIRWLGSINPELNNGMACALAILLLPPWVGSLFHSWMYGRKVFGPNSVEEFKFMERSAVHARGTFRYSTVYRDMLEMVLGFGAGDIEGADMHGNVIKRFDNVIGLRFYQSRLEALFRQHQVDVVNAATDPAMVREVEPTIVVPA